MKQNISKVGGREYNPVCVFTSLATRLRALPLSCCRLLKYQGVGAHTLFALQVKGVISCGRTGRLLIPTKLQVYQEVNDVSNSNRCVKFYSLEGCVAQ